MAETTDTEPPQDPGAPGESAALQRWVWVNMKAEERPERLAELALWVDWLAATFPEARPQIARCWYRHDSIRDHLTALYLGWARTYAGDPSKLGLRSEMEWVKEFHAFLPWLGSGSCRSGHQDTPNPQLTDGEAYTKWVDSNPDFLAASAWHPAQAQAVRLAAEAAAAAQARAARGGR